MADQKEPLTYAGPEQQGQFGPPPLNGVISGRPMFASVDVVLGDGQKVLADGGAMTWMDAEIPISTDIAGGLVNGCCRALSGESCCMNTFTGPGRVGFSFPLPGDMMAFAVSKNNGWQLSQKSFIAGTDNLKVSGKLAGCGAFCAGEGLVLTKVTTDEEKGDTPGMFYAGGFGSIKRHDVAPGQTMYVDNGMFFAAHEAQKIGITIVGGSLKAKCCSGEGFVMVFHGPCVVFTQSRDPTILYPGNRNTTATAV